MSKWGWLFLIIFYNKILDSHYIHHKRKAPKRPGLDRLGFFVERIFLGNYSGPRDALDIWIGMEWWASLFKSCLNMQIQAQYNGSSVTMREGTELTMHSSVEKSTININPHIVAVTKSMHHILTSTSRHSTYLPLKTYFCEEIAGTHHHSRCYIVAVPLGPWFLIYKVFFPKIAIIWKVLKHVRNTRQVNPQLTLHPGKTLVKFHSYSLFTSLSTRLLSVQYRQEPQVALRVLITFAEPEIRAFFNCECWKP